MTIDRTHILVLNYNGRELLAECLPSIIEAAAQAPVPCGVTVVDNDSTDDSRERVAQPLAGGAGGPGSRTADWPRSTGCCKSLDEPVVLLLNNDVKLEPTRSPPCSASSRSTTTPCSRRLSAGRSTGRTTRG